MHACMHACMHAYPHTYIPTCTHTHRQIHAYIHAYIHTDSHTYILRRSLTELILPLPHPARPYLTSLHLLCVAGMYTCTIALPFMCVCVYRHSVVANPCARSPTNCFEISWHIWCASLQVVCGRSAGHYIDAMMSMVMTRLIIIIIFTTFNTIVIRIMVTTIIMFTSMMVPIILMLMMIAIIIASGKCASVFGWEG